MGAARTPLRIDGFVDNSGYQTQPTLWVSTDTLLRLVAADKPGEALPPGAIAGGFVEPFDTFADMSHLIERESWDGRVAGIAYFCNVLPTPAGDATKYANAAVAARAAEDVRRNALRFLQHDVDDLLPGATRRYHR